jgi:hypothetical protein
VPKYVIKGLQYKRRKHTLSRSAHVGFVVEKVALGQVFSEYFGFPCQSSSHQLLHNHHRSSGAGTIGQHWPTYQADSVSPHPEKKAHTLDFDMTEGWEVIFTLRPFDLWWKNTSYELLVQRRLGGLQEPYWSWNRRETFQLAYWYQKPARPSNRLTGRATRAHFFNERRLESGL